MQRRPNSDTEGFYGRNPFPLSQSNGEESGSESSLEISVRDSNDTTEQIFQRLNANLEPLNFSYSSSSSQSSQSERRQGEDDANNDEPCIYSPLDEGDVFSVQFSPEHPSFRMNASESTTNLLANVDQTPQVTSTLSMSTQDVMSELSNIRRFSGPPPSNIFLSMPRTQGTFFYFNEGSDDTQDHNIEVVTNYSSERQQEEERKENNERFGAAEDTEEYDINVLARQAVIAPQPIPTTETPPVQRRDISRILHNLRLSRAEGTGQSPNNEANSVNGSSVELARYASPSRYQIPINLFYGEPSRLSPPSLSEESQSVLERRRQIIRERRENLELLANRRRPRISSILPRSNMRLSLFQRAGQQAPNAENDLDLSISSNENNEDNIIEESNPNSYINLLANRERTRNRLLMPSIFRDDENEAYQQGSEVASDMLESFGAFGLMLFSRLKKLKIASYTTAATIFMRKMIEHYIENIQKIKTDKTAMINIKNFMTVMPSLSELRNIYQKNNLSQGELFTFKIVLDFYENYLKVYDSPLFEIYRKKYIPLAIEFYNSMPKRDLRRIIQRIKALLFQTKATSVEQYLVKGGKDRYVKYYINEVSFYSSIGGGNRTELFIK